MAMLDDYKRMIEKPARDRAEKHRAALQAENERLRARLDGIENALKERGLFAFEHVDGSFSLNRR